MKIYHYSGDRSLSERFFSEALVDYINESGLSVPASAYIGGAGIVKGPHGKPYFEAPELMGIHFSKSHTGGHEIVCFSDCEVGVDCENTERRPGIEERYQSIAVRYFTEDELDYIRAENSDDGAAGSKEKGKAEKRLSRFFEVWTAKEAYMKYTGKGFSEGFRTFSIFQAMGVTIKTDRLSEAQHVVYSVCSAKDGA